MSGLLTTKFNNMAKIYKITELGTQIRVNGAIETAEQLVSKLSAYIKEPKRVEKLWFDGQLF